MPGTTFEITTRDRATADLTGADLTGADLTGADLTGADLTGADLSTTGLSSVDLSAAHRSTVRAESGTPWRILLVNGNGLFRSGLEAIVDAQPDMQVVASTGDADLARPLAQRARPDVAVVEPELLSSDGLSVLTLLAVQDAGNRPPPSLIALVGPTLSAGTAALVRGGVKGFVCRTGTPDMLCSAVRAVATGNCVLTPDQFDRLVAPSLPAGVACASAAELTAREKEIALRVAQGACNADIARELFLSESTVKAHIRNLLRKLHLRDRLQIAIFAREFLRHELSAA